MIPKRARAARQIQIGGALLASLLLVVVTSATWFLAEAASRRGFANDDETLQALQQAKQGLIHYAITDSNRPGELPCPDVDRDGKLKLNVDFFGGRNVPCATLRGWLPHATLGLPDLRDSTGQRLWYALTDDYHAGHAAVLNSDTPGGLKVGAADDIVAVVIAASAPVDSRQAEARARSTLSSTEGSYDARVDMPAYLEGANADADTTRYAVDHASNDRLVTLTRRELMAMAEQRVLAEYVDLLSLHRAESGSFPWLSVLADPGESDFKATVGTRSGHLSLHRPGERFETAELKLEWSLVEARETRRGSVHGSDLSSGEHLLDAGEGPSGRPECVYSDAAGIECTAVEDIRVNCRGIPDTSVRRRYAVAFNGDNVETSPADAVHFRRRRVRLNHPDQPGAISASANLSIRVEDVALDGVHAGRSCGAGTLRTGANTRGYVVADRVRWELAAGEEIPRWIVDEQ